MSVAPAAPDSYPIGPSVRLEQITRHVTDRCRCGARLREGMKQFVIVGAPESVRGLLSNRSFCSIGCVRAFLLESLAEIDSMTTPLSQATVTDLRDAYLDLSRAFAELRFDLTRPPT